MKAEEHPYLLPQANTRIINIKTADTHRQDLASPNKYGKYPPLFTVIAELFVRHKGKQPVNKQ